MIAPCLKRREDQAFSQHFLLTLSLGFYAVRGRCRFHLGVKSQDVANTGLFTKDSDGDGTFDTFEFTRLGAELNIWYDRNIKQWLQMQYRLGLSSDYLEKVGKSGLLTGLFITKFKIISNLYLTHRGSLKGDFAGKILKPFYSQTVLLSFAKAF
ncbi:MAG: hypothetical protein V4722_14795 [Bacteroidota bacterium]